MFLAFLPSASSAIVQLYHPQDILSLGLAAWGLAQTLRRRWVVAGALFGLAFLSKQFAVLLLLPALVAAPDLRARARLAAAAAAVFAAGILPFAVAAPRATLDNLSGFSAGGAIAGSTVLSLLGVTGSVASAVARDAPVVFAALVCLWAVSRYGSALGAPVPLVSLTLACVGSRLVFESVIFPYYLLATSVIFFMLDLVAPPIALPLAGLVRSVGVLRCPPARQPCRRRLRDPDPGRPRRGHRPRRADQDGPDAGHARGRHRAGPSGDDVDGIGRAAWHGDRHEGGIGPAVVRVHPWARAVRRTRPTGWYLRLFRISEPSNGPTW